MHNEKCFSVCFSGKFIKSHDGKVAVTRHMDKLYFVVGAAIPLFLEFENQSKLTFDHVKVTLQQHVNYSVHVLGKVKTGNIVGVEVPKVLRPGRKERMQGQLKIPKMTLPSTPEVLDRKIRVAYELHVDLICKGKLMEHTEKVVNQPLLISNVPYLQIMK